MSDPSSLRFITLTHIDIYNVAAINRMQSSQLEVFILLDCNVSTDDVDSTRIRKNCPRVKEFMIANPSADAKPKQARLSSVAIKRV